MSKCFCIFVVFPPLNEISTLQVLQVALLSSVLVKYNQTFERLSRLGAVFPARYAPTLRNVVTSFGATGIDKGIVCKNGKRFQGIETVGTGSQQEPVFDTHPYTAVTQI